MSEQAACSSPSEKLCGARRAALLALVAFVLFFELGARGLNEPDEGRYSEIGREMAESGDFLTPRMNGIEHLSKPPMTYWLIGASVKMFGASAFAARLPAALAAAGTLWAVFLLVRSVHGEKAGALAVLILLSSVGFFGVARLITTDMILTCCISWSVWLFWRWHLRPDRGWRHILWFYVALGLGMLIKGPVAVVIPLFAVAGVRWRHPTFRLGQMHWGKGLALMLAVSAPWFVAIAWQNPSLWDYFLRREVLDRVATTVHKRVKPWWFFLPVLAAAFLPWVCVLPAAWPVLRRAAGRRTASEAGPSRDLVLMCVAWAGLGLLMFTLVKSKLPTYILPLLPPLAVLAALAVLRARAPESARSALFRAAGSATAAVLLATGVAGGFVLWKKFAVSPALFAALAALGIAGAAAAALFAWRGRAPAFSAVTTATALLFWIACVAAYPAVEPNLSRNTTAKFFGERIRREDPEGRAPVISYVTFMCGLPFYLDRQILWYNPASAAPPGTPQTVYEFNSFKGTKPMVLTNWVKMREMFAGPDRVFCVIAKDDVATLRIEMKLEIHELQKAGKWALVSNRPPASP